MHQLPELAKAIRAERIRAADEHRQLCAPAYAARRDGAPRGIARLAGLRLVPMSPRRGAQVLQEG